MRESGDLLKWLRHDYRDEWAWRRAWKWQVRDAVADRRMEDSLVKDMRDSLEDGSLLPEECAQLLIEWESKRFRLVEQRLLVDLYELLKICTIEQARKLLGTLASDPDFKQGDNRNPIFSELCQEMANILANPDISINSLMESVRRATSIANSLGDPKIGIVGAAELYAFYLRLDELYRALRKASPGSLNHIFVAPRERATCKIPYVEAAEQWLDRFVVDRARKDVKNPSPALLWFYVQQAKKVLAEQEFGGTVIEHRLCSRLAGEVQTTCLRLVPRSDPVAWLDVEMGDLVFCLANRGGNLLKGSVWIKSGNVEIYRNEDIEIPPFGTYGDRLELSSLRHGKHSISINLCGDGRDNVLSKTDLYLRPGDGAGKGFHVRRIRIRPKYDEDPEVQEWTVEPAWWRQLKDSLGDQGSVKIVYGLPRVGKTTGLKYVQKWLNDQEDVIPVYVNLGTLLPGDDAHRDLSMLRRDILDQIESILVKKFGKKEEVDFVGKTSGEEASANFFERYISELSENTAYSAKLVVMMDEWSRLQKFDLDLAKRVVDIFVAMMHTSPAPEFVVCASGIVDRDLLNEYQFAAEASSSLIAAAPFPREKVKEILTFWLRPENPEVVVPEFCYDDLAVQLTANYTGGHPLLLLVFAHHIARALFDDILTLPISWRDVERMWKPLLSESTDMKHDDGFARFRIDMYDALETIWLGLSDSGRGTSDRWKLRYVLEGEHWAQLWQMLECGLVRLDERQHPILGIQALEPWYRRWISGRE